MPSDKAKQQSSIENMQVAKKKHSADVVSQTYYLVIGFEVNGDKRAFSCTRPKALKGDIVRLEQCTQNLDVKSGGDFGHAFFYIVDNSGKIMTFLALLLEITKEL